MTHLRLVPPPAAEPAGEDGPRVSLRLLMAASGRCSCDDCLWAYRRGNRRAGIVGAGNVGGGSESPQLSAVR